MILLNLTVYWFVCRAQGDIFIFHVLSEDASITKRFSIKVIVKLILRLICRQFSVNFNLKSYAVITNLFISNTDIGIWYKKKSTQALVSSISACVSLSFFLFYLFWSRPPDCCVWSEYFTSFQILSPTYLQKYQQALVWSMKAVFQGLLRRVIMWKCWPKYWKSLLYQQKHDEHIILAVAVHWHLYILKLLH